MRRSLPLQLARACLFALLSCALLAAPARAQSGGQYHITQSVLPGGGGVSNGGAQRLEGTIGQSVVGTSTGGNYTLDGGFVTGPVAATFTISGQVTLDVNNAPLYGVTLTLTKPDNSTATATTDASGDYSFTGLAAGSYTVAPSKTNYSFSPPSQNVSLSTTDQAGVNFSATSTAARSGAAGTILISEFRLQGPVPSSPAAGNASGELDEFIELYNNTDSPADISGFTLDTSAGFSVAIPSSTVIPPRGHYLLANTGYSLSSYAVPDQTYSGFDLAPDAGLALLDTSGKIVDAAGFTTSLAPYKEGAGLKAVTASVEGSYFRKECDFVGGVGCTTPGTPKDTNDNSQDFKFADTQGTFISGVPQALGAPGPENLSSPMRRDSTIAVGLLDNTKASSASPNRVRDLSDTSDPNTKSFGTLSIRRRVVNQTGGNVTRIRFRIVEMTTFPAPGGGVADLRALTSTDTTQGGIADAGTCSPSATPCTVTVRGTTLEQPSAQPNGGGINSTLAAGVVTLGTPLANGASIDVQFLLGVQTTGTFRFLIITEALP